MHLTPHELVSELSIAVEKNPVQAILLSHLSAALDEIDALERAAAIPLFTED
jgi:hypothetical protein